MGIERADAHLHSVQAGVRFINQSRPGTDRSVSAWLRRLRNWQHFPQLSAQFSELDAQAQHLPFGGMSDAGNAVDLSVDLFEAGRDFRLEVIDSPLQLIESRLESRLEWIESRLKVIESCVKVIESCVKVIESSIESIESSLKLIAPALGSLVEFLDSLKDSLNGGLRGHFVSHYFMPSRKE